MDVLINGILALRNDVRCFIFRSPEYGFQSIFSF